MIVSIFGGGPSAADLDTRKLPGLVIGVNDAGLLKPCDIWFTLDHNYALEARERIDRLPALTEVNLCMLHRNVHLFSDWRGRYWRRVHTAVPPLDGQSLSSGPAGTPGCSGYVAINLAAALGGRTIYLHGYDFHEPYRYWFDDAVHARREVRAVIRSFRAVALQYEGMGIEVINCNPNSAIRCFRFDDAQGAGHAA